MDWEELVKIMETPEAIKRLTEAEIDFEKREKYSGRTQEMFEESQKGYKLNFVVLD